MSSTQGVCAPCASGDHVCCHGECSCKCPTGGFAPDTMMPARSKTKALRETGAKLAAAVHELCVEGSEADAPYWHRASDLATEMEVALGKRRGR